MAVIVIKIWRSFPFMMLSLLAQLQVIDESLYEAARIDGANNWQLFWHITMPHVTEGQEGAAQLMRLPVPPTAIVAPNDMAAIGAIVKLKELNVKVPEDVAVVGFDNIGIAQWYDPSLTTVDQPRHQMGERAMQELLKRLENPSAPAEVVKFETSLIIRNSSGGPRVRA